MRELGSQVTVVGEQEHTRCVTVEAADRIDALRASILDEIHHSLALLRIIAGGNSVFRLVKQHVDLLLKCDGLIVEDNGIGALYLGTQLLDHLAINEHYASLDEIIGFTT